MAVASYQAPDFTFNGVTFTDIQCIYCYSAPLTITSKTVTMTDVTMTNIGNTAYFYSGNTYKFNAPFFYIYLRDQYTSGGTTYTETVTVTSMNVNGFYGGYSTTTNAGKLFYVTHPGGSTGVISGTTP